jgi:hypothetical protein
MSANPGKVQILGVNEINGEECFVLNFLQARNKDWVGRPFLAKFNKDATWLSDLKPAFGKEEFFYTREFRKMLRIDEDSMGIFSKELNDFFNRFSGKF